MQNFYLLSQNWTPHSSKRHMDAYPLQIWKKESSHSIACLAGWVVRLCCCRWCVSFLSQVAFSFSDVYNHASSLRGYPGQQLYVASWLWDHWYLPSSIFVRRLYPPYAFWTIDSGLFLRVFTTITVNAVSAPSQSTCTHLSYSMSLKNCRIIANMEGMSDLDDFYGSEFPMAELTSVIILEQDLTQNSDTNVGSDSDFRHKPHSPSLS